MPRYGDGVLVEVGVSIQYSPLEFPLEFQMTVRAFCTPAAGPGPQRLTGDALRLLLDGQLLVH